MKKNKAVSRKKTKDSRGIDAIGGTSFTALLCDVSSPAVSQWRKNGIPPARRAFLGVIYPDTFPPKARKRRPVKSARRRA